MLCRILIACVVVITCCVPCVRAQPVQEPNVPLAGHSHHGAAFNEGPRQSAYLVEGCGDVHFEITSAHARAQRFFDQGIGQLHGFWYFEAERSFRQVAASDPDCAMAYWGMAMANFYNEPRAYGFIREGFKHRDKASERERRWLDALVKYFGASKERKDVKKLERGDRRNDKWKAKARQFVQDLEDLVDAYPDDVEPKAFLVNQLWLNQRHHGIPISSKSANSALLDQIFAANPKHPAHHYRIHLWDTRRTAKRAVKSAANSGPSSPGIAHQWHMGGHIWAQLHRHGAAAWSQEASARVDHAHMMRDRVLPDEIHNYAHNNEWLTRSLRNIGAVHDATALAKNMVELPRHPKWNTPDKRSSSRYGRQRLIETLEQYEQWEEILRLEKTMYLEEGTSAEHRADRRATLGMARFHLDDVKGLERELTAIGTIVDGEKKARTKAGDEAEEKAIAAQRSDDAVSDAMRDAMKPFTRRLRTIGRHRQMLEGFLALSREEWKKGLADLDKGRLFKPHLARLHLDSDKKKALKIAKDAAKRKTGVAYENANLAYIQYTCGETEDAKKTFEKLREYSSRFDLDMPVFKRLAPLAKELGHDADWRVASVVPGDVGDRPDHDALGPFRWSPMPVLSSFTLPDGNGKSVGLDRWKGKPVLIVFFLGFDCLHCVEQLQALSPVAKKFQEAGVGIVTVGSCTPAQIKKSVADAPFPFPILADPALTTFKQWRVHDDFEKQALHGTFLVDGQGLVRWQDISYEPFMEVDWLLAECQRLLALPTGQPLADGAGRKGGPRPVKSSNGEGNKERR